MDDKEKVIKIISVITKIDIKLINESSSMNDHSKWDSLAHLNIMEQIERNFKKKISTSKMSDLSSVDKILKFLKK
jgi:acyl carrier protein